MHRGGGGLQCPTGALSVIPLRPSRVQKRKKKKEEEEEEEEENDVSWMHRFPGSRGSWWTALSERASALEAASTLTSSLAGMCTHCLCPYLFALCRRGCAPRLCVLCLHGPLRTSLDYNFWAIHYRDGGREWREQGVLSKSNDGGGGGGFRSLLNSHKQKQESWRALPTAGNGPATVRQLSTSIFITKLPPAATRRCLFFLLRTARQDSNSG